MFSNCIGEQTFTVDHIEKGLCLPSLGTVSIKIYGTFSQETSIFDFIYIEFTTSEKKIQSECQAIEFDSYSISYLSCEIDISFYYPLNYVDIFLPVNAPQVSGYKFVNWEKVIGNNPDTSNKITISCLPKESNTFNINSITANGCSKGNNTFTISGEWSKEKESTLLESNFNFKFYLGNEDNDIAYCKYNQSPSITMNCQFNGAGNIKINEKTYFNSGFQVYTFSKYDGVTKVEACSEENKYDAVTKVEDGSEEFNSGYSLKFNIINILIPIVLFF